MTTSSLPSATVAVLTYNGERYLDALLTAVEAQHYDGKVQLLVIDSGSTDRTLDIVAAHGEAQLHSIPKSEFGHGRTRNLAAELATGDIVVYLTHDAVPAHDRWLAEIVAPFVDDERISAVFGSQKPRPNAVPIVKYDIQRVFARLGPDDHVTVTYDSGEAITPTELAIVTFYSDANSAARREVLRGAVPYRDVDYAEDQWFARDLFERGFRKAYAPLAAVEHSNDAPLRTFGSRITDDIEGLRPVRDGVEPLSPLAALARFVKWSLADSVRIVADRDYSLARKAYWLVVNPCYHAVKWARLARPAPRTTAPGARPQGIDRIRLGRNGGRRVRPRMRFKLIYLAPLFAFLTLGAWAFASPVGSSPDDDHHLVSTWCASQDAGNCLPGTNSTTRVVPAALLTSSCYAFHPEESAACQLPTLRGDSSPTTLTDRGNFRGAYPPLYYATMGLFAGHDIESSAVTMRLVNSALCVALVSLVYAFLPPRRRSSLVWGWLITVVPLGLFLIASNNPSGWAVTGVGTAWIALLGYFETTGRRRIALAALFAVSVLVAAGSRADSALYVAVSIGAVLLLKFTRERAFWIAAILPFAGVIVATAFLLTSNQIGAGINGFGDPTPASPSTDVGGVITTLPPTAGFTLLAFNVLNLPDLWTGVFGGWGLGWLDTYMPPIVLWAGASAFIAVCFAGLARMDWRKALVVSGIGGLLIAMPLYVLAKGGDPVGANVQPRYLLPLVMLLAGFLLLESRGTRVHLGRAQMVLIVTALSVSNLVALQTNIRRYVTGADDAGLNLNAHDEWWWRVPFSPMEVWIVGSLAFAATVVILAREMTKAESPAHSL